MSYRERRNFIECMRTLGMPEIISYQSFTQPNFPLVVRTLKWLIERIRYDPTYELHQNISTEQGRILFIKSVESFMISRAQLKVNIKRLYMADGYAVRELLKLAKVLYQATTKCITKESVDDILNKNEAFVPFDISRKIEDLRELRRLSDVITETGTLIYEMLNKEIEQRSIREFTLNKQINITDIEKSLKNAIVLVQKSIENIEKDTQKVKGDSKNIESKINKKTAELTRNSKRLETLQNVRPAYMDEFETYEEELKVLYERYMDVFRNKHQYEVLIQEYTKKNIEFQKEIQNRISRLSSNENLASISSDASSSESKYSNENNDIEFNLDSDNSNISVDYDKNSDSEYETEIPRNAKSGRINRAKSSKPRYNPEDDDNYF
ncbi:Clusterin-associated protein 1 [Intoshia linei]|uniref:Clusterin-associated protein 1 n=1 Tax=Intoshia linei TaxID=1819745 RepID=A0A177BD85_9BILA|nr:Clusterin-associated protein 1 [Intoshia linei]